jgi:ferritin-like metal-binding protein YciE
MNVLRKPTKMRFSDNWLATFHPIHPPSQIRVSSQHFSARSLLTGCGFTPQGDLKMAFWGGNIEDLRSLYTTQLRHLLSTEEQIVEALPKMIDAATDTQLKQALQTHLQETKVHRERLDDIMNDLSGDSDDKKCAVTAALISAGEHTIKAAKDNAVRDAGIIAAAQKVEHFEIASYGSARDWASLLGEAQHAALLQITLDEEKHADQVLTAVAHERNPEAARSVVGV